MTDREAQAKFHNGVLEITISVPEQPGSRRAIPIEVEGESVTSELAKSQATA
jgi:hypothetical protein